MKLSQNVYLDEFLDEDENENGSCEVKTRSLCQILKKHCVRSRGLNFYLILIKYGQNVCLDEILDEIEIGSCGVKN